VTPKVIAWRKLRSRLEPLASRWRAPEPLHVLGFVLIAAALCRVYLLRTPNTPKIFDETYYVNAARIILGHHVAAGLPYSGQPPGLDPNHEHPPLGKLLIAGSIRLFGDNGFGWRLPSVLAGIACIALVYAIVRAVSDDGWLAVLAAAIFAFDNLVLVHSRIATLDAPMLAFLLLGAWCWLRGWPLAAGAACGLAALVKLPAFFGLIAVVLLGLGGLAARAVRRRGVDWRTARATMLFLLAFAVVWAGGLWLMDLAFTSFDTPWAHAHAMLNYGFSIRGVAAGNESRPWSWLINEIRFPYFRLVENVTTHGRVVHTTELVNFEGAMNPVLIGAALLAVPYIAWRAWRYRDALSLWVVAWIAGTYLAYYPLILLSDRTTYLYYILPALPATAIAIAMLLREPRVPALVTWGYLAALLVGFAWYFPFHHVL
jgi:dolichyl-phosphate-mannose-protein mannosyltransferase